MEWFRWYHGATSDPKWPLIARKAGVSVGVVVSVWAALLEHASQDEARGSVADFDGETFDALYGYEDGTCAAVVDAMREKGVLCDGCICSWQKRQPRREDDTAAERKRQQRSREKEAMSHNVTHRSHNVTLEQRREEKKREELTTPSSLENKDNACALNASGGETEEDFAPAPTELDQPCIGFVELREYWDRECKPEGPLSGWQEYKALKAARQWPGMGRIAQDVAERYASGAWEKGWAKALGNYLRERYWLAEVKTGPKKQPRASPRAPTEAQRRMAEKEAHSVKRLAARGLTREGGSHEHGGHDCGQVVDITNGIRNIPLGR